jgi:tRNA(fMet)-specific endonuclease VapC
MFLLDTNIISELVKKRASETLRRKLKTIPSVALYTASICVMELRYGSLRRGDGGVLWSRIHDVILSKLHVVSFGYREALKAGEILSHLHSTGQPIGIEDILIASVALSNGLIVVTANTKHFSRVPELAVENWLS